MLGALPSSPRMTPLHRTIDPCHPFLCRLLMDNSAEIVPYELQGVREVLDGWEVSHPEKSARPASNSIAETGRSWRSGFGGVSEGQRNAAAASVVGAILGRLPEHLWEVAAWGGLEKWNQRNSVPLPERELRSVFESIARRERAATVS